MTRIALNENRASLQVLDAKRQELTFQIFFLVAVLPRPEEGALESSVPAVCACERARERKRERERERERERRRRRER